MSYSVFILLIGATQWSRLVAEEASDELCSTSDEVHFVQLLQSNAPRAMPEKKCSMGHVFGDDRKLWPGTVPQAEAFQLAMCASRGYDKSICKVVIDEHFRRHYLAGANESFSLTQAFCRASLELFEIDDARQANSSYVSEDGAHPKQGASLRQMTEAVQKAMGSCAGQTCSGGQPMVYHSFLVGCVCEWCENNTLAQLALCLRKCKTGDTNMCAQCFPSDAAVSVRLQDGAVTTRTMRQLRVGDAVRTQSGFSKIFAFMDHDSNATAEYVQLETASGYELSLTADHIVYAHADRVPVLANSVGKGDLLWTLADVDTGFVPSRVVSVKRAFERGMHAPLTEQGSVVVNGVLASSYAKVKSLRWGTRTLVSGHDLNRYMHEPLRLACGAAPALCGPGWHSPGGRHAWTQLLLDRLGWLQAMNQDHSDIRVAFVVEASASSWLSGFAQLGAAALLSAMFGPNLFILLLGTVAAAHAAIRCRGTNKRAGGL